MVLDQGKVSLIKPIDALLEEGYAKKLTRPSMTVLVLTPVLGLVTVISCLRVGMVSKKF